MADKVIELNPRRRLDKESLEYLKSLVATLDIDTTESVVIIAKSVDKPLGVYAYNVNWDVIGSTQALINLMAQEMLREDFVAHDIDEE